MDSKRLAEIADVMEDRGLTRVRVEEPDGTAVELERASAAQPVAVPMPMPSAMASCSRVCGAPRPRLPHRSPPRRHLPPHRSPRAPR